MLWDIIVFAFGVMAGMAAVLIDSAFLRPGKYKAYYDKHFSDIDAKVDAR